MSDAIVAPRSRDASTTDAGGRGAGQRLRIVLYGQSLSGTGHFVRIYELARALAARHEVHLFDGGRAVPRPRPAHPFAIVALPRIRRMGRDIVPLDPAVRLDAVMSERRRTIFTALEQIRPDVVVVEHFPFSKWALRDEIVSLVQRARAVRPSVRVLASLRDIPPGTGDDPHSVAYRDCVVRTIDAYFDGLLVHTDPALVSLEEHIPWVEQITKPLACTGYVSEKLAGRPARGHGSVIVSTGGAELPALVRCSVEAWQHLRAQGLTGDRRLVVFLPPFSRAGHVPESADPSVRFEPFTTDFLPLMAGADLSVSQAGYNTCTNILEVSTPAIVVPNGAMSDQVPRARRLAARGLASVIASTDLTAEGLASVMLETLASRPATHNVDLHGADTTRALIEQWCTERAAPALMVGGV